MWVRPCSYVLVSPSFPWLSEVSSQFGIYSYSHVSRVLLVNAVPTTSTINSQFHFNYTTSYLYIKHNHHNWTCRIGNPEV